MRVVYCGVVNENAGEIDLNSEDFKYFDPGFYNYISRYINQNLGVPSTKVCHDLVCCPKVNIFIVGKALSTILDDKILLCIIKMLVYLDEAWGIITMHTTVYTLYELLMMTMTMISKWS